MNDLQRFEETRRILAVITTWVVFPLYFAFWLIDVIYQPDLKWALLGIRLLIIPVALLVHFLNGRAASFRSIERIALFYAFINGLLITLIILYIGVPVSPYYAGLCLVAIAGLGFVPWSPAYFVYAAVSIFLPYYLVEWYLYDNESNMTLLMINSAFIIAIVMVTAVIRVFRERLRQQDLHIRQELEKEIEHSKAIEKELIVARDLAMSAAIAKSNFISNMSHEIRTPLNAIIGYGELLQESLQDSGMQTLVADADKINQSGRHLMQLVNNILDVSKIDSGRMEIICNDFIVEEMVNNLVTLLQPLFIKSQNSINIQIAIDSGIMSSDETKVRQVLFNLLCNANKFTHNGTIQLTVERKMYNSTEGLNFTVEDDGIGIAEDKLDSIFEAFTQADTGAARNYEGTGLGLSITKRFCHMLGGDVMVSSNEGEGAIFTVWLPRRYIE